MQFASDLFVHIPLTISLHLRFNINRSKRSSAYRDKRYDLTFYPYLPTPLPGVLEQSEPWPHPAPRLLHFRRIPAITLQCDDAFGMRHQRKHASARRLNSCKPAWAPVRIERIQFRRLSSAINVAHSSEALSIEGFQRARRKFRATLTMGHCDG
jgi:hypothetical protein